MSSSHLLPSSPAESQRVLSVLAGFTASFPKRPHPLRLRREGGDVILLTGTTGGFGCNILSQLSLDPSVAKIYALNRASPREGLASRQMKALAQRGILEECQKFSKFQLVEADLSKPNLGLTPELYTEICNSVTHIIHNAWSVNLIKPLGYFEECLQGLRNLIDLALASPYYDPPRFVFVSSMGMLRNPSVLSPALEVSFPDPSIALKFGYTESKWIAERILIAANQKTGLHSTTVRVGFLCGDRNGTWAPNEMYPQVIKSAIALKCLPDVQGEGLISWTPSWEAAEALCAMRHSTEPVLHLANPNPIPWKEIFEPIAEELKVPLVPIRTWLALLQWNASNNFSTTTIVSKSERIKRNPAIRLIPYLLAADLRDGREPIGSTRLDLTKGLNVAPTLKNVRIGREMAIEWVKNWRKTGFLPFPDPEISEQKLVARL